MTNDEFCKMYSAYFWGKITHTEQLKIQNFNGEELKEFVEHCIQYQSTKERIKAVNFDDLSTKGKEIINQILGKDEKFKRK